MPAKVKVRIVAGRDLPVMDRASELTDAFAEVKFGSTTYKTEVYRKSLNPLWNSEWYRFEVDDEDLQDEPLQIKVLDHDTYSAHDAIGKVYIDLNPLLFKEHAPSISGWFPIYDTMHGIRGELNVVVKIDLFSDFNKFRQSSCGVQLFCSACVPGGHRIQAIHGFVEELVVNDDPEYQWIDKIRSQRASNEARQIQFSKLSGELQRKLGLKVLEMGGNAVIGYRQCFDLEGESGVVVRAIGTSVTINKVSHGLGSPPSSSPGRDRLACFDLGSPQPCQSGLPHIASSPGRLSGYLHTLPPSPPTRTPSIVVHSASAQSCLQRFSQPSTCSFHLPDDSIAPVSPTATTPGAAGFANLATPVKLSSSPAKVTVPLGRRSSDSDIGTPPKGSSLTGSSGSGGGSAGRQPPFHRPVLQQHSIEMLEYPFFTMRSFPPGFIVHLGGVVSARSVKLLDKIHNPDEPETRDVWWIELRTEVRSHARAMGCHAVVGYSEHTTICEELIVLSACGTAALVNLRMDVDASGKGALLTQSLDRSHFEREKAQADHKEYKDHHDYKSKKLHVDVHLANQAAAGRLNVPESDVILRVPQCGICHIPYNESSLPFSVNLVKCAVCRRHKVPDVLFTTIEPPPEIAVVGKATLVQARICRAKKEAKGETNAKEVSDCLPFMEYELHNQLWNKLKVKGMNCLFGLKIQVVVGERLLVAIASATAVYAAALPPPSLPKIISKMDRDALDHTLGDLRKRILEAVSRNKELYGLHPPEYLTMDHSPRAGYTDEIEEELNDVELCTGNKDTFLLEIDDAEDAAVVAMLLDPPVPEGFGICTTESMPGVSHLACTLQMFTRVWRGELSIQSNKAFSNIFDNILRSLFFKLRTMAPCCLCHVDFDVKIHDEDDIQVGVTGIVAGVGEPPTMANGLVDIVPEAKMELLQLHHAGTGGTENEDLMFPMEGLSDSSSTLTNASLATTTGTGSTLPVALRVPKSASTERRIRYHSGSRQKQGIELTPLPYVMGSHIEQYLGHLNFFLIRESTSVKEVGGLNGFMHAFVAEVKAICRAHVATLGGNALVAFQLSECVLDDNLHKNQSQSLVNVCGDVVMIQYDSDIQSLPTPGSKTGSVSPMYPASSGSGSGRKGTPPRNSPRTSPKVDRTARTSVIS